jgi:tRNA pseudouridine(55) synthase
VVVAVRRILRERRVGHAGTLDPPASGLLVVLVGRATRLARFVAMLPKRYGGTIRFGWETATDDAAGEPVGERDDSWRGRSAGEVEAALARVAARTEQMPPAVSAKKVAGRRAYRLARRGAVPPLSPAPIAIHALTLQRFDAATGLVEIAVECSSGTYVRAVARDVGRELGSRAHLAALRRTAIGRWRVEDAVTVEHLGGSAFDAAWLRPMTEAVAHLPSFEVGPQAATRFRHGQPIEASGPRDGFAGVYHAGVLLGVAERRDACYHPAVGLVP